MIVEVDTMNAIEGSEFSLIPEGTYEVEIIEVGEATTKGGDPMAKVRMEILKGEYAGRLLFDNIIIPGQDSPAWKIIGRTMHFLHTIGQPYRGQFQVDTDDWLHKKLKVKVKHETYKDEKQSRVAAHDFADGMKDSEVPF